MPSLLPLDSYSFGEYEVISSSPATWAPASDLASLGKPDTTCSGSGSLCDLKEGLVVYRGLKRGFKLNSSTVG